MKIIAAAMILLLCARSAEAQCYKEVTEPQKSRQVARLDWLAAGRPWKVALFWHTKSVSDNGDEEASVVFNVSDNPKCPLHGDFRVYHLTPNRCDEQIDPQLSTVKLMGRDFLLVTVPDGGNHGSAVVSWMYSIDEKGHLTQVFHSVLRGHFMRTPECRYLLKSFIRADTPDGSRISWVYQYPDVEWVKKRSECKKAKLERMAYTYEWKNGCFTIADRSVGKGERLITSWDDEECVTGKGLVTKAAPPDGGTPPASPPAGQTGSTVKGEKQ